MFKKILKYALLTLPLILAASCSQDEVDSVGTIEEEEGTQQQKPNWVAYLAKMEKAPDWKVDNSDFRQSMTATITFDDASMKNAGFTDMIAAFAGDELVGVAVPDYSYKYDLRYFLYINEPQGDVKKITIAYYNNEDKVVRYWPNCFDYTTDKILGTVSNPFILKAQDCNGGYPDNVSLFVDLPKDLCTFEPDDEVAVFVGDECRVATIDKKFGKNLASFIVPIKNKEEMATVRYYSSLKKRIYTSPSYPVTSGMIMCPMEPMATK